MIRIFIFAFFVIGGGYVTYIEFIRADAPYFMCAEKETSAADQERAKSVVSERKFFFFDAYQVSSQGDAGADNLSKVSCGVIIVDSNGEVYYPIDLGPSAMQAAVEDTLQMGRDRDALVFVHGHNDGLEVSARRLASMADEISFEGLIIIFSWPSNEPVSLFDRVNLPFTSALNIRGTRSNNIRAVHYLRPFLQNLKVHVGGDLNVLAHSQGALLTLKAAGSISEAPVPAGLDYRLEKLINQTEGSSVHPALTGDIPVIDRLILEAPNVSTDELFFGLKEGNAVGHTTIYCLSNDLALQLYDLVKITAGEGDLDLRDDGICMEDSIGAAMARYHRFETKLGTDIDYIDLTNFMALAHHHLQLHRNVEGCLYNCRARKIDLEDFDAAVSVDVSSLSGALADASRLEALIKHSYLYGPLLRDELAPNLNGTPAEGRCGLEAVEGDEGMSMTLRYRGCEEPPNS